MNRTLSIGLVLTLVAMAAAEDPYARCRDELADTVVIDAALDSPFFRRTDASWPWHIVEHDDGTLEDTFGGAVDRTTVKKLEHTANCVSSHQGEHRMDFCDAQRQGSQTVLTIDGGMPAYASSLRIIIDGDHFTCAFEATYPGGMEPLRWRITRKELRLREKPGAVGGRLHGWLSVEFEETVTDNGQMVQRPHRIEGYLKPVLR